MIFSRNRVVAAALCTSLLLATATTASAANGSGRGALIEAVALDELPSAAVVEALNAKKVDSSRVRFGVRPYRITYRTVDPNGRPTTATGLVVLPANQARELRPVAWLHGTTVFRGDVASVNPGSNDRATSFLFASAGYAVVAPDYIGLGEGPGSHPYLHPATEASSSIDALRAGRALTERRGVRLDERVLVSGFSQGGQSTMALGKELQRGADRRMRLGALAPIAGPYAMSRSFKAAVADEVNFAPAYMGYLSTAWDRLYGLYGSPAEAFSNPAVEQLFDGHHTNEQVFSVLPKTVRELLTPEFKQRLDNPSGALRRALESADRICDWRPAAPTTLFMASGDHDVLPFNSEHCGRQLEARGAKPRVVDVGDVDHSTSVKLAAPKALKMFDES